MNLELPTAIESEEALIGSVFINPDIFPDKKTLSAKIIGNSVPPLLYEKIIKGLIT